MQWWPLQLPSPFSLTEARVLYEIKQRHVATASDIAGDLGLDAGYLSRILRRFEKLGLIRKQVSPTDGRQSLLSITAAGRKAFAPLEARTKQQVGEALGRLGAPDQERLVGAMRTIEGLLGARPEPMVPYILRPHRPGDMGWVVHRHGVLYAREYGWDERFEALVAEIVAKFIQGYDPRLERCWIAERESEIVGCVFLVRESEETAKLRLLLVEPEARGLGIGSRLVEKCIRFARQAGYLKITLWTNDVLNSARRIYEGMGFLLVQEEPHRSFGHDLVGQTWELIL